MKALLFVLTMFVLLLATVAAADLPALNGTWSGNWTPKGGVPDAVTIEVRQESAGPVTGKFLNPAPMEFSKVTFIAKTGVITIQATDPTSGKHYKLEGKVEGTELKGTL